MAKAEIMAFMAKYELQIDSIFIPHTQSRSAGDKMPSLNWRVSLSRKMEKATQLILSADYTAGLGHCPSSKGKGPNYTIQEFAAITKECEEGRDARIGHRVTKLMPDSADVISSMSLDADVLNYSDFESWARDMGYDPDSRSAEKIYQACMVVALKLRNGLGETRLQELKDACQDY